MYEQAKFVYFLSYTGVNVLNNVKWCKNYYNSRVYTGLNIGIIRG
jgi:hypothetical protein